MISTEWPWIERDVLSITHQELQRVLPGRQLDPYLGLPAAEVKVITVVWDRLIERRQVGDVDQEVMVGGLGLLHARWGYAYVAGPHPEPELATFDHLAVRRPNDADPCVRRCWLARQHR
jgi:hypothetical protein